MGNDWQDSSFQDRRRSGDARQRQTPQSSQSGENYRQDGRPEARDNTAPPRGPANRLSAPMPPRRPRPQGGSGMLSWARHSGREMPPEPRRTRDLPPGNGYNEPTIASGSQSRRISAPRERSRNTGGGLLSFARAVSSTMRAIITGNHRAMRPERPSAMMEGAPTGFPGEETPRPHRRYEPYKRSRVRLVIHKRQERRQVRGKKLLISGIVSSFFLLLAVAVSIYGGSNVYAFYGFYPEISGRAR